MNKSKPPHKPRYIKAVNETSPKHRVIAEQLLCEIEEGRWRSGERIPSEERIAEETGASLGTVQRALRNLAEMGVVQRHHGRGTFVAGARTPQRHLRHFRFVAEDGVSLLPIYVNVQDITLVEGTGPWSASLGACTDGYVRLQRLVSIAREFSLFSEMYLRADRFGEIVTMKRDDFDGASIRDLLAEQFNAPTFSVEQFMLCQPLPPRVVHQMGVPLGTFGVIWTITGLSYRNAPITWQRVFMPPNDRPLNMLPPAPETLNYG